MINYFVLYFIVLINFVLYSPYILITRTTCNMKKPNNVTYFLFSYTHKYILQVYTHSVQLTNMIFILYKRIHGNRLRLRHFINIMIYHLWHAVSTLLIIFPRVQLLYLNMYLFFFKIR